MLSVALANEERKRDQEEKRTARIKAQDERRTPDKTIYRRPGVRVVKSKSPWTFPASRHFPRREIWNWSESQENDDLAKFEEEFCRAGQAQAQASDKDATPQTTEESGTNYKTLRKAPSLRNSVHEQLISVVEVRRNQRDGASKNRSKKTKGDASLMSGSQSGKSSNNANSEGGRRQHRPFSIVKNYRKKNVEERKAAMLNAEARKTGNTKRLSKGVKANQETQDTNEIGEGEEDDNEEDGDEKEDSDDDRMPTPTLESLGLGDRATGNIEVDRSLLETAPEMLIEKHASCIAASSSQQVFVDSCRKSCVLPEPMLNIREDHDETMEASKMFQNYNVRVKKDLLQLETRDVILWDWRIVAKGRTVDELKLEHYGIGDLYTNALADALAADAKQAKQGRRSFRRINLSSCRVSAKGVKNLARSLRDHPRALRLDLSRNALGPWAGEPLCTILQPQSPASATLSVLDLSDNGLGDNAVIGLCQALRTSVVEWLNLSKNDISARGAISLATFLREQQPPEDNSNLMNNSSFGSTGPTLLEKAGSQSFFNYVNAGNSWDNASENGSVTEHNSQDVTDPVHYSPLSTLLLDWNRIQGAEATILLQAVTENKVLLELSLAWNGLATSSSTLDALVEMVKMNTSLVKLSVGHNRISASCCSALLEQLPFSDSLLSVDLSGNDDHEDIFSSEYALSNCSHKVSESWSTQSINIEGKSLIYSRYSTDPCPKQQALVNPEESLANSDGFDEESANDPQVTGNTQASIAHISDHNLWKRRGVCWLSRRWVPHTIWYYPNISGPPSSEIFIEFQLPGGSAMCVKMHPAPELQSCATEAEVSRPSRTSMTSSVGQTGPRRNKSIAMSRHSLKKNKQRESTLMFKVQKTMSGANNGAVMLNKMQMLTRGSINAGTLPIQENDGASAIIPSPPSNGQSDSSSPKTAFLMNRSRRSHLFGASQMQHLQSTGLAKYDYRTLKAHAIARPSNLSSALLQSIQNGPQEDLEVGSKEMLEGVCDLSLSNSEPICPAYATIMLPPGRTYFKFIVRSQEIFARDIDTCWTMWPLSSYKSMGSSHDPTDALDAQHVPTISNFVDNPWPFFPVGGLSNPDPGAERPQPKQSWSIKRSIFRHHVCDNVRKLASAFNSDWEQVLENHYVIKAAGDELPYIRELLWAHFSDICTLFTVQACDGVNSFAFAFDEVKAWLRSNEGKLIPDKVQDEILYDLYDKSALLEARRATNQFGRHYTFMVKRSAETVTSDPGMIRYQLLQFIILLATRVYSDVRLTTVVATQQDQEIARAQLRRVAPRRRSSLETTPESLERKRTSFYTPADASTLFGADGIHREFGTPFFKSAYAAVHHFLKLCFLESGQVYIHRDVFRRGHFFFQDVVNVFMRHIDDLRRIFDSNSVKGHVLHDFIPGNAWEDIFLKIHPGYSKVPLRRIFALSKSTFVDFEDPDFAPGLCFLEFLECLARLAHLDNLATTVLQAFDKSKQLKGLYLKESKTAPEDALTIRLEMVIRQLSEAYRV